MPEPEHYLGQVFLAERERKKRKTHSKSKWPELLLQWRECDSPKVTVHCVSSQCIEEALIWQGPELVLS